MIVDDEELILELLVDKLSRSLGVRCITAGDGKAGLEILKSERPDAVLSDINMPKMNGFQLLEAARKEGIETPFIFLTAYGDKEKAITALRLGAHDFLEKPFHDEALRKAVSSAVELGIELRSLDAELEQLCARANLSGADLNRYKLIRKAMLVTKKQTNVFLKKAG